MGDGVIVQQGQHHGHRRAVIAPQGGVLRPKPVAPMRPASGKLCTLELTGLPGGHSGAEIHKNIPNADRVLAPWSVPGAWTHTMSVCPWRITAGCPS